MLSIINKIVNFFLDLGPSVMLPIIITLFGLILKQGLKKSFRAGLTIGVGFVGINLVIGLLSDSLGPAAQSMVKTVGLQLDVMDVGWPIEAAISYGTTIAPLMIPIIMILNIILISINYTKTIDVDIWNYFHIILTSAIAYYITNNMIIALLVGIIITTIVLKLADWTAPVIEHHFGYKGVTLPHTQTISCAPFMYALNRIQDKIPGLNKLYASPETLSKRFGIFGEPIAMGLILGIIIGALGRYDLKGILILGVQMASILILMPRMVSLLMEGLMPISEGAREFLLQRFPGKKINIGLDAAIAIGNPANMSIALFMVPVTIVLAIILPYNRMLPFADFSNLPFVVLWAVAASRGNIIRGLINSILFMLLVFFIATNLAPLLTHLGHAVGFDFPKGATSISSIDTGTLVLPWIVISLLDPSNPIFIVGIAAAILYFLSWFWVRHDIRKQYSVELNSNSNANQSLNTNSSLKQ